MAPRRVGNLRGLGGAEWAFADRAWSIPIRIVPSPVRLFARQHKITMHGNRLMEVTQRYTPRNGAAGGGADARMRWRHSSLGSTLVDFASTLP